MESENHITNLGELACAQCACVLSAGKMADRMYGQPREGALDLANRAVPEKTPQIFWPSLPAEYMAAFSRRTEAPEVRCDLTNTHTHTHTHTYTHTHTHTQTDRHGNYRNMLRMHTEG